MKKMGDVLNGSHQLARRLTRHMATKLKNLRFLDIVHQKKLLVGVAAFCVLAVSASVMLVMSSNVQAATTSGTVQVTGGYNGSDCRGHNDAGCNV